MDAKNSCKLLLPLLSLCFLLVSAATAQQQGAPTPPLGWNSYDAYGGDINEAEFRANVDVMARTLKPFGWQYAVIDYLWYNPVLGTAQQRQDGKADLHLGADGRPLDPLTMDKWGRLMPSPNRFPSAAGGQGFKLIADAVHASGLKFGIHIMRGIPRQAVWDHMPVMGTNFTADQIADRDQTCLWLNYNYGVDPSRPGAQAYYDSIFALYAQWGVDFVKVDDASAAVYHAGEIALIANAIRKSGRPMVLSLSPGETPLGQARHVTGHANMWRLSNDFWDEWPALLHAFDLVNSWSPWAGDGHWPDPDMLPLGHLGLRQHTVGPDRQTRFTPAEQQTLMTLWAISRAPLMMGGDLLTLDPATLALLTNRDVLQVDQQSQGGRQIARTEHEVVWLAAGPDGAHYVALFNLSSAPRTVNFHLNDEALRGTFAVDDLWTHQQQSPVTTDLRATVEAHGARLFRLAPVHSPAR